MGMSMSRLTETSNTGRNEQSELYEYLPLEFSGKDRKYLGWILHPI